MRRPTLLNARLFACLVLAALALAQEGHPLTGTWTGDWGPDANSRTHLTFVMNWDGKAVTGIINPGSNAMTINGVAIDFATWNVRIDAATKDSARVTAEGKLENLGSTHRTITGTWRQGAAAGDFKITRD